MGVEQRYRVVDRLEAGGMAEVFRGEALSVQGFKKQVAIKRVLPHLAQNKSFISMFLDEARLGARLNHANIVSVFDIGAADDTYFIVMEFVEGCNLKALVEHFRQIGQRLPAKDAVYICQETCRGLSYAHELTGDEDEFLHIVHRDISPPNILLSKRGEIKVTDFGLAKASTQLEKTDPGVVKGKFSYLAPEAALGGGVDARADIFALGIVLWEMLAGRRLFLGDTDYQTVKLVQEANIPSLQRLNPDVDPDLEAVLARALARDPDERFGSAREFGDALAGYLFSHQLKVTSYDIANLVKSVLEEKASRRPPARREASIIDRLIQEELLRFTSLDDIDDSGSAPLEVSAPLSPDSTAGAMPLDASLFENPADWFADDQEVAEAVGAASDTERPGAAEWVESGIEEVLSSDLANLLESSGAVSIEADIYASTTGPAVSLPPSPGSDSSATQPVVKLPDEPGQKGGATKWIVIGLVAALLIGGAAAAAVLGGFI